MTRLGLAIVPTSLLLAATAAFAQGSPTWIWPGGGHEGIPYARLTPDRQTLVSGASFDTTTKVWRASDGTLERTLVFGAGAVNAVAVSPDSSFAATASELVFGSGMSPVQLWRLADGALIRSLSAPAEGQGHAVAFSPDGSLVAGAEGSVVFVWRVADGALLRTLTGHAGDVFAVTFSPSGQLIATGSQDDTAKIWNAATGALQRTLTGHTFFVSGVAFSPDGTRLATSSWDATARIWNVSNGQTLKTFTAPDALYAVDWSPIASLVATGGTGGAVRLFDPATGASVRNLTAAGMEDVFSLGFASDGATVVAGSADGHARRFDVATGALVRRFGVHSAQIDSVAYAPSAPQLASSGPDTTIVLWDKRDGTAQRTLTGHTDEVGQVVYSPDGSLLASCAGHLGPDASLDHSIKLWNPADGSLVRTLAGHSKMTWRLAFTPDGSTLASGGEEGAQNSLRIWRVSDGALLKTITGLPDVPRRVLYTKDGQFLLVAVSTEIRYYSVPDYVVVRTITTGNVTSWLDLSPAGDLIAATQDAFGNNVRLWRFADGAPVWTAIGHPDGFAQSVAFAPDGETLLSGSGYARDLRIWRVSDGALLQTYDQETGYGQDPRLPVALDPTGEAFSYGRTDATVIVAEYPFAPTVRLVATANPQAGTVHIAWSGGTGPFTLVRATNPQFTENVTTLVDHQNVASFDDPVLFDGATYYYDVR